MFNKWCGKCCHNWWLLQHQQSVHMKHSHYYVHKLVWAIQHYLISHTLVKFLNKPFQRWMGNNSCRLTDMHNNCYTILIWNVIMTEKLMTRRKYIPLRNSWHNYYFISDVSYLLLWHYRVLTVCRVWKSPCRVIYSAVVCGLSSSEPLVHHCVYSSLKKRRQISVQHLLSIH